jgi:hypothetical protein
LTRLEPLKDDQGRVYRIVATAHMINERKQARLFLQRQSDLCATMGEWWPTVVSGGGNTQEVLQGLARILVHTGGYAAAWVGIRAANGQTPEAAAAHVANEPPDSAGQTWLTAEAGPTLAAQALEAGQDVLVVDVQSDAAAEPWRQPALQAGCAAMLVVPAVEQPGAAQPAGGALVVAAKNIGENDNTLVRSLKPHLASIIRLLHRTHRT